MKFAFDREAQRLRRFLSNGQRRLRLQLLHGRRDGVRVLANSFPKSGTYMLSRCLSLLPDMEPYHDGVYVSSVGKQRPSQRRAELARVPGGCFVSGHLPYQPDEVAALGQLGFRPILILRDPRDIAVSYYRFESSYRWLPHHRFFAGLPDDASRLAAVIRGDRQEGLIPIVEWINRYSGWLSTDCYVTTFERLVGADGGGSSALQRAEVANIATHCGIDLSEQALNSIADRVFSRKVQTFRKGQIGGWRDHFSAEHRVMFKEQGGSDLLIKLGYETDDAW